MVATLMEQRAAPWPDFSQTTLARATTPNNWFGVITNGRLDKLMPPWADSLNEAERWSLVAYLYTLSTPAGQIEQGQALYTANCARCHGATGAGDGPEATQLAKAPRDLSDLAWTAKRSQQDYFDTVAKGNDLMPAFADKLTEAERWAVVDYARTFAYDYAAPGEAPPEQQGSVTGRVTNGTAGGAAPAGLEVTLHGFTDQELFTTLTATTSATGHYTFANVPYASGRQFVLTTSYLSHTYISDITAFPVGQKALDLPLKVYETTTDPSGLRITQMHTFIEFASNTELNVVQLYVISNVDDRTFVGSDNKTIEFGLPAGYANLTVQDGQLGETYRLTDSGGFAEMRAVPPGKRSAQALLSFSLPYDAAGATLSHKLFYPADSLSILLSDLGVTLEGDALQNMGIQTMSGMSFQNFNHAPLTSGGDLAFTIKGEPGQAQTSDPDTTSTDLTAPNNMASLAVGLGALALVLIGGGLWWYRRAQTHPAALNKNDLIEALAELDDAYAAGEVEEAKYQEERAWLKEQLKKIW
jgi:mono/diheme cytochrome c family protein